MLTCRAVSRRLVSPRACCAGTFVFVGPGNGCATWHLWWPDAPYLPKEAIHG